MRFLNILNPAYLNFTSPLAWGGLNIVAFGIVSVLYILMMRGNGRRQRAQLLAVLGALLALGLPIYTGYDLTVHQSRPVWNTPLMPVLFVGLSPIASGSAVGSFLAKGEAKLLGCCARYMLWSTGGVGVDPDLDPGHHHLRRLGAGADLHDPDHAAPWALIFIGIGMLAGLAAPVVLLLAPIGRQQVGHR